MTWPPSFHLNNEDLPPYYLFEATSCVLSWRDGIDKWMPTAHGLHSYGCQPPPPRPSIIKKKSAAAVASIWSVTLGRWLIASPVCHRYHVPLNIQYRLSRSFRILFLQKHGAINNINKSELCTYIPLNNFTWKWQVASINGCWIYRRDSEVEPYWLNRKH